MSAALLASWQTPRLRLQASQAIRTVLGTLWAAFGSTRSAEQLVRSRTAFLPTARFTSYSPQSTKQLRALHTRPSFHAKASYWSKDRVLRSPPPSASIITSQDAKRSLAKVIRPLPSTKPPSPMPPMLESSLEEDVGAVSSNQTQDELNAIFGQEVDRDGAVQLLSTLQQQRREGTLDREIPFSGQLIDKGLEYLRGRYLVDEDAAIIARVDREIDGDWSLPQMSPGKSISGRSALQEIREINKAKREDEKAQREAEEKELKSKHGNRSGTLATRDKSKSGTTVTRDQPSKAHGLVISEGLRERMAQKDAWIQASNRRVAELREAATEKRIPQMSRWQRLWPSGVFTFSAVGLALMFAHVYTPPSQAARLFPETPPAAAAVGTIVALNILVFILWRLPHAWKTMNRNFIVTPANPRSFSMLGAEFSHQQFNHMFANMLPIWLLGTQLHDDIGRGPFLALVVCGAVLPSFCSLIPPVMKRIFITATLGASGILTTLLGASCVLHEGQKIKFPILPPEYTSWMNTAVFLAVMIAIEVGQFARAGLMPKALINTGKQHMDHVGHLAGYGTGIVAGCLIRQIDPYWGSAPRKSFWRWKKAQAEDPAAEMLMKSENLGINAATSTSSNPNN